MTLKQSLPLILLLLCLASAAFQDSHLEAASPSVQKPPVEAPGTSDPRYTKMANAVLSLHKRIQTLENKIALQDSQITQMNSVIGSLRQNVSALRADENFDRSAISTLHQRLNLLDSKSGSIVFPGEEETE